MHDMQHILALPFVPYSLSEHADGSHPQPLLSLSPPPF